MGFRVADHLFTPNGRPFGWVDEEGAAWHADGRYLGAVFEDAYVLREPHAERRTRRRMHPARTMRPVSVPNRQPRLAHPALEDGLAWLGEEDEAGAPTIGAESP